MKFTRKEPPKSYRDYRRYRPYTRRDFKRICAYCFRHEEEAGGEEAFVQDHFEPRSRPNVHPADYFNLYWCCGPCNLPQNKGANWPTAEQVGRGEVFCDPCDHDPVGTDYRENEVGRLDQLTPAGEYTIRHIRLNDRRALVNLRVKRRRVRGLYLGQLRLLRQVHDKCRSSVEEWREPEAYAVCRTLDELIDAYEELVKHDPFMLDHVPPEVPEEVVAGI